MSDTLRPSLSSLNRARLIAVVAVPVISGLLRHAGAFPYALGPFAVAVVGAVAACAIWPLAQARIHDPRAFARVQLALDVALVSVIVATTGGVRSVFVPLYVLTVVAAAFALSSESLKRSEAPLFSRWATMARYLAAASSQRPASYSLLASFSITPSS